MLDYSPESFTMAWLYLKPQIKKGGNPPKLKIFVEATEKPLNFDGREKQRRVETDWLVLKRPEDLPHSQVQRSTCGGGGGRGLGESCGDLGNWECSDTRPLTQSAGHWDTEIRSEPVVKNNTPQHSHKYCPHTGTSCGLGINDRITSSQYVTDSVQPSVHSTLHTPHVAWLLSGIISVFISTLLLSGWLFQENSNYMLIINQNF